MRRADLFRFVSDDDGTRGVLVLDTGAVFVTGEDPDRDNLPDKSCVLPGTFLCSLKPSAHFKENLYHLEDRNGRTNVMLHVGNFCGNVDKGKKSDVEGCILLGMSFGFLEGQTVVAGSAIAIHTFMDILQGQPFELTIHNRYKEA